MPESRSKYNREEAKYCFLRCQRCGTPIGEVRQYPMPILLIKAKHHGEEHISVFDLENLLKEVVKPAS